MEKIECFKEMLNVWYCMLFCVAPNRQNRKERFLQRKWSHIEPHLIGPLDEKEVSLKVNALISNDCNSRFYFLTADKEAAL